MTCPVCERQNIPAEAAACPQCDTDLRGLRLITAMRAAVPTTIALPAADPPARPWWPLAAGAAVLLCGGLLLGRGLAPAPNAAITPPAVGPLTTAAPNRATIQELRDTIETLRKQQNEPPAVVTGNGFAYVVRRGDTLRRISWRLYGRTSLASRLQAENRIDDPRRLAIGQKLHLVNP